MKAEDYFENLCAVAKDKLDMFNSLAEETSCFWSEIRDNRYDWEVNRNEALALRSVTKDMVLGSFDKWLKPGVDRRMMVINVISAAHNGGGENDIDSASLGRPEVDPEHHGSFCDDRVKDFHQTFKDTWGKFLPGK